MAVSTDQILIEISNGTFLQNFDATRLQALRNTMNADRQSILLAIATSAADRKSGNEDARIIISKLKGFGISLAPTTSLADITDQAGCKGMTAMKYYNEPTALHTAILMGCESKIIEFLVAAGCDVNLPAFLPQLFLNGIHSTLSSMPMAAPVTPLAIAVYKEDKSCFELLCKLGASLNPIPVQSPHLSPLLIAAYCSSPDMFRYLLEAGVELCPEVTRSICPLPLMTAFPPSHFVQPKEKLEIALKRGFGITDEIAMLCFESAVYCKKMLNNILGIVEREESDIKENADQADNDDDNGMVAAPVVPAVIAQAQAVAVPAMPQAPLLPAIPGFLPIPAPMMPPALAAQQRTPTEIETALLEYYDIPIQYYLQTRLKQVFQAISEYLFNSDSKAKADVSSSIIACIILEYKEEGLTLRHPTILRNFVKNIYQDSAATGKPVFNNGKSQTFAHRMAIMESSYRNRFTIQSSANLSSSASDLLELSASSSAGSSLNNSSTLSSAGQNQSLSLSDSAQSAGSNDGQQSSVLRFSPSAGSTDRQEYNESTISGMGLRNFN